MLWARVVLLGIAKCKSLGYNVSDSWHVPTGMKKVNLKVPVETCSPSIVTERVLNQYLNGVSPFTLSLTEQSHIPRTSRATGK